MKTRVILLLLVTIISHERGFCQTPILNDTGSTFGLSNYAIKLWKKDKNGCLGHRSYFADSILNNQSLIGLSKNEIRKLLGKPDEIQKGNGAFIYYIGTKCDSRMRVVEEFDSSWLVFLFERDKLREIDDMVE